LQTTVPIDLVHFAGLVPMHVMSLILGIPEQDCSQLAAWASELREFIWGHSASPLEIAMKTQDVLLSLHAYFKEIVRHSAAINGTGIAMMVEAVNTGITGDRRQEALRQTLPSQCCALLVAGYYTTADLLSNGIYALLRHPEQLRLIIENAELSREAAREASRYDSPVHTDGRIVTQKCELLGRTLEPGQMVVNLIASANHDEEKFPEPDIFNIYRAMPQKALTFGTSRHHCVGERLALMELALVFRNLVPKFPRIRLLQHNIEYKRDLRLRGVKTLPVILQPE
jgi:pimeloyl-[acyl-carrier protein] synthase